jgi:hypothetical protein
MARTLSFSNYLPALSPAATMPNSVKPIPALMLSVRSFNKPIKLVSYAGRDQKMAMVEAYRGGRGFDLDDAMWSDEEEEEEEMVQPELDPNFDLDRIKLVIPCCNSVEICFHYVFIAILFGLCCIC